MRVLRFSRYLRDHGWEPIVCCVDGGAKHEPRDPALLKEVPDIQIERVPCFEPDNYSDSWDIPREKVVRNLFKTFDKVLFPDDRALWIKPVTKHVTKLLKKDDSIKVVWATAQPWSTLVAGRNIKKATGVPLVLDFRDDWTTSNADFRKVKKLEKEKALEQTVLASADAVISVTPHIVEQLQARAPKGLSADQFHYIPNGFDPSHFETRREVKSDKFTIAHTGGLYHLRPITPLLRVLDCWFDKHPERAKSVTIELAGRATDEVQKEIAASRWSKQIHLLGFVQHEKVRDLITSSALNLLMIEQVKTAPWLFTGKVFEYIGARRPILMLGPDPSPLADLLRDTGLGRISGYENPEETAELLETLYQERLSGSASVDESQVEKYNAHNQTQRLARIFEEVACSGKS